MIELKTEYQTIRDYKGVSRECFVILMAKDGKWANCAINLEEFDESNPRKIENKFYSAISVLLTTFYTKDEWFPDPTIHSKEYIEETLALIKETNTRRYPQ